MTVQIYGLKNCDTCRKARKWLDAKGVNYEFTDVREEIPPPALLKKWHAVLGDALLNRSGTTWRQLSGADKARAEKNPAALLHDYPALMKRPVLVTGADVHVGFTEKTWREFFKKNI